MRKLTEEQRESISKVLSVVSAGLLVAGTVAVPGLLLAFGPLVARKAKIDRHTAYRTLCYAKRRSWITVKESAAGMEVVLTERGRRYRQLINLHQPLQDEQWDGKWRIVIFDIPHKVKRRRDNLRYMLRQLGFVQLQKSVWITPYRCREHIEALKQLIGLHRGIHLVTAIEIEHEAEFKRKFNL